MAVPLRERTFEDYRQGEVFEFGDYLVTRDEIIEFASRYDPQVFHLDDEAAARSHFGGLVASGWMTCAVMMRLLVEHYVSPRSSMGSPGLEEIRWLLPVRPGDRLRVRVEVLSTRASSRRPDRGYVMAAQQVLNQHGEAVLSVRGTGMYLTRAGLADAIGAA